MLGSKNRVVHHYSSWFLIRRVVSNTFFAIFVQPNSVNLGFARTAFIVRKYPAPGTLLGRERWRVYGKRLLLFFITSWPKHFPLKPEFSTKETVSYSYPDVVYWCHDTPYVCRWLFPETNFNTATSITRVKDTYEEFFFNWNAIFRASTFLTVFNNTICVPSIRLH